jgi:hypothetical protein
MREWEAIAARLQPQRLVPATPRRLTARERKERERRWADLRAQLGWAAEVPLTPEQEVELDRLVHEEIEAHRKEARCEQARDPDHR